MCYWMRWGIIALAGILSGIVDLDLDVAYMNIILCVPVIGASFFTGIR